MPCERHLQGHSKISCRVLHHFGDLFNFVLHGYEGAEKGHVNRNNTWQQVSVNWACYTPS